MKSFVVVFAIFVMAAFARDPEIPYDKLCSMQGSGRAVYNFMKDNTPDLAEGDFDMKRVNGTAIFNVNYKIKRSESVTVYLIRPDVPDSYLYVNDDNGFIPNYRGSTGFVPVFADYKYQGIDVCGRDSTIKCHWFGYQDQATNLMARIAFNKDDMSLVSEYFTFDEKYWNLEVFYTSVDEEYQHFQIDDAFSCSAFGKSSPANTDAPWALTSACVKAPDFPYEEVCSIQAVGSCTYVYDAEGGKLANGNFDMKRVNGTAIFNIQFQGKANGIYLIRPDVPDAYWFVKDAQGVIPGCQEATGFAPIFSQYTYSGVQNCGIDYSLTCHWFGYADPVTQLIASIAFKEDDMSLVSETFSLKGEKEPRYLQFYYSKVEDYTHIILDKVFSSTEFGDESPAATIAPWTLSYVCTSPSSEPSSTPGSDPSSTPGSEPSSTPGSDPSSAPGSDPSSTPGSEPSSTPGSDPSSTPGSEPSSTPGSDPSSTPGSQPSSTVTSSQDPKSSGSTGPFEPSSTSLHLPSLVAVALFAVAFILV